MASFTERTAILVDGGFYRIRAQTLFGDKSPEERADELFSYCMRHLNKGTKDESSLYRIFYYDCPPSTKVVYNPVTQRHVNLGKSNQYRWTTDFFRVLVTKRKVALRRGEELASSGDYTLRQGVLKDLCAGRRSIESLTDHDTRLNIMQKGVDMRIGLDIASLVERGVGERCRVPVRVCKKSAAPAGLRTCVEFRRGRNSLSGGRPSPGAWCRRAR